MKEDSAATGTIRDRRIALGAIAVGTVGLVLSLALEADIGLSSGIWYPIIYAGTPAVAATGAFAAERPDANPLLLAVVLIWVLVSSVAALALAVVLAVGFGGGISSGPVSATLFAGVLYLGYLLVPTGLAIVAARRHGAVTALSLAVSPVGQAAVAIGVIVPR